MIIINDEPYVCSYLVNKSILTTLASSSRMFNAGSPFDLYIPKYVHMLNRMHKYDTKTTFPIVGGKIEQIVLF